MIDERWRLFCINAAYCHMFERENYESYYFNCALTKTKNDQERSSMIKKAAGYGKGKKCKNLNFSFKTALCCRFEHLMYFTFWIIP